MSRIGINTMGAPRRVVYMPLAKIDYMEKEHRSQTVHLDQAFIPDKKFFKGWIIGLSYFVGITENSDGKDRLQTSSTDSLHTT